MAQDWIDVVIPYHLVRTGREVAKALNYTNYTAESADTKTKDWKSGDQKYIAPTEHNNDRATYMAALERNHLKPRFERFIDNPNYMKLVNETRQSAANSKPVQPVFDKAAAKAALGKLETNGYYQPIGGSVDRMYEIAAEVGDKLYEAETADKNLRFSFNETEPDVGVDPHVISEDMSDKERAAILQNKKITAPVYRGQADKHIQSMAEDLHSSKLGLVKSALLKIGAEFSAFGEYEVKDIDVQISFSKSNLKESVSKDVTPEQVAKLLPILHSAVENAIGIERHVNRYVYDAETVMFDNLLGGFVEGESFTPVRFGLKRLATGQVTLYVVVDQEKIDLKKLKAEVVNTAGVQNARHTVSRSAFEFSLSDIIQFVNDKDLLRYLPDDMLSYQEITILDIE